MLGMTMAALLAAPGVLAAQQESEGRSGDGAAVTAVVASELHWSAGGGGYGQAQFARVLGTPGDPGPFVFRMRMPANWTMPAHTHDTAEHITVLSGTLTMKFSAGGDPVELPPGSFVSVPAGGPMWAWTGDEPVELQIHGTGPFHTSPVP
jgi:quercetin dioxygenase-like cupin family protein